MSPPPHLAFRASLLAVWLGLFGPVALAQPPPTALETRVGETEVVLRWAPPLGSDAFRVYRAPPSGPPAPLATVSRAVYVDRSVSTGTSYTYTVVAVQGGVEGEHSAPVEATPLPLSDADFLLLLQRLAFDYFWYEAHPETGLVPDRTAPGSASSVAAVGFGLTALGVGAERGWIQREAAAERAERTLRFLWEAPQGPEPSGTAGHRGFFYHFLDMETGHRAGTTELSTVDTALLMAGVLYAGAYFDGPDEVDAEIQELSASLYERVDWTWAQVRPPLIGHGWTPERGHLPFDYGGYSEAMLLYLLALGSPTHPVGAQAWSGWTAGYRWATHYGFSFVEFAPLFGHQYTHAWVDFRGLRDAYMRGRGIDYFENSRRATLAQRAYAVANPAGHPNYGPDEWGLTASDGPDGYRARGTPPPLNDDGTIAPTAAGGSVAFAPEEATAALRRMYTRYRNNLWGEYGFRDAYNLRRGWFATDYIGIDQGPFVLMIENLLTEGVWDRFMEVPAVQAGLERAGFEQVTTSTEPGGGFGPFVVEAYPNPARTTVTFRVPNLEGGGAEVVVYDALGRVVARHPVEGGGVSSDVGGWAAGTYFVRLEGGGGATARFTVLPL